MNTDEEEIVFRIRRIYAAIGSSEEKDLGKLKAKLINTKNWIGFHQDFCGGLNDAELSIRAYSVIDNIAKMEYHFKKWATSNKHDATKADQLLNRSSALQIIKDLANTDKHAYPFRNSGCSGRSPQLVKIYRRLQLTPKPQAGSSITVRLSCDGTPKKVSGNGSADVILTGDIVDKDGKRIGDLNEIATEAVKIWEQLLCDFGITLPNI